RCAASTGRPTTRRRCAARSSDTSCRSRPSYSCARRERSAPTSCTRPTRRSCRSRRPRWRSASTGRSMQRRRSSTRWAPRAAGRAQAWREAAARFQPALDWAADDWYGGGRWLFQLHVFQYPFYYLDYALARLVSWELWLESLEDESAALDKYLALCDMGGTK